MTALGFRSQGLAGGCGRSACRFCFRAASASLSHTSEKKDDPIGKTLDYPIGIDPVTGQPILVSYPGPPNDRTAWPGAGNDNFLTPVYFRRQVLDHYLSEPRYYTVSDTQVKAGHMWSIPIAITERGHVQVWLGDLGGISKVARRHWQHYAITDDDAVPDWRIRRDLHVEWIGPPRDEGVDRVKAGVEKCNKAALGYCGVPLFTPVEGLNAQRIETLHRPLNDSQPEFQHQVISLAILIVDHLNVEFLQAVGAQGNGGPLSRLAAWIGSMFRCRPSRPKTSSAASTRFIRSARRQRLTALAPVGQRLLSGLVLIWMICLRGSSRSRTAPRTHWTSFAGASTR